MKIDIKQNNNINYSKLKKGDIFLSNDDCYMKIKFYTTSSYYPTYRVLHLSTGTFFDDDAWKGKIVQKIENAELTLK